MTDQTGQTTLLLVRHGQTVGNVDEILQGQTQGELTPEGVRQATEVRESLRHRHIDAFVSSDLARAVHTCRIIAEPHGLDIVTTPLLRERDWGSFTGLFIPDLKGKQWPTDIETIEAIMQRAKDFIEMVARQYAGQTVVAVGHGIINKAIQSVFFGKPMHEIAKMANAEVRTLNLSVRTS